MRLRVHHHQVATVHWRTKAVTDAESIERERGWSGIEKNVIDFQLE